jgi:hypothetical protein
MSSRLALKLGTSTPNPLPSTQYETALHALLLENASLPSSSRVTAGCESCPRSDTPRPRLVGIELNPGPSPAAVMAGIAALSKIAATVKAKRSKPASAAKPRKSKGSATPVPRSSSSIVTPPVAKGYITRSSIGSHTPFILKGRHIACTVVSSATGNLQLLNADGVTSAAPFGTFSIDPLGNGSTQTTFASFPLNVRNLSKCFLQYRLRKLKMTFSPLVGSSTLGGIVFAPIAEVAFLTTNQTYARVAQTSTSVSCPIWETVSLDATTREGLSTDWRYLDNDVPVSRADLRLESPGSLSIAFPGNQTPSSTFGFIWFDYEIEYKGMADESAFGSHRTNIPDPDFDPVSHNDSLQEESKEDLEREYYPPHAIPAAPPALARTQPVRPGFFG